jgi:hypothetical protein
VLSGEACKERPGLMWYGEVRCGAAGEARTGLMRFGTARQGRLGWAWFGAVWCVEAGFV